MEAELHTQVRQPLDSVHQKLAHSEAVKMDVRPAVEAVCLAADFPQCQVVRTEVEEKAYSVVGMACFLEEGEERRGHREEVALGEAFHVLLGLEGPQTQVDQLGRTEGKEEVDRRLCCRAWAQAPLGFEAWDFVLACPGRRSRKLCCQ